jgi:hypothetical protein
MGASSKGWKPVAAGDPGLSGIGRRTFIGTAAAGRLLVSPAAALARASEHDGPRGTSVVWQRLVPAPANFPALGGHTDTVPDIVGRIGAPIGLGIFTEGNISRLCSAARSSGRSAPGPAHKRHMPDWRWTTSWLSPCRSL